jgi:hypothetical protein
MVGLQAMVLGRLGWTDTSPSKSVCSILPIANCGPELPQYLPGYGAPALRVAPMPQCQPALIFAQWGTPPEGPPFPSKLVSKHIPAAKKTPISNTCKGC